MSISDAIDYIVSENKELEAIEILLKYHNSKYKKLHDDCRSAKSSLKAINKINASNNKDKKNAIDLLSEV